MPKYGCFLIFLQIYLATVLVSKEPRAETVPSKSYSPFNKSSGRDELHTCSFAPTMTNFADRTICTRDNLTGIGGV